MRKVAIALILSMLALPLLGCGSPATEQEAAPPGTRRAYKLGLLDRLPFREYDRGSNAPPHRGRAANHGP